MDEHLRRQVTWLVVAGAVLCLIIYAGGRRSEVNRLRDQIAYGSPAQRLAAVERLVASQKLADAVTDSPRWVQDGVVEAVTRLGTEKAIFQLMTCWTVVDAPVQPRIQAAVARFGALAIPPLVEAMTDKDAKVRAGAPGVLTAIGAPTIPYLLPLMGAWDDYIRTGVATVFGGVGEPVTKDLVKIITRGEPAPNQEAAEYNRERDCAVTSLLNMKAKALGAITGKLLVDDNYEVRGQAATMLGTIGAGLKPEEVPQVVPPLVNTSKDQNWNVRRKATAALGALGAQALLNNVVPVLMARLDDSQAEVRAAAAVSMGAVLGADVREAAAKAAAKAAEDAAKAAAAAAPAPAAAPAAPGAAAPAAPAVVLPPPPDPKTFKIAEAQQAANKMGAMLIANTSGASRELAAALVRLGGVGIPPLQPALKSPTADVRLLATQTVAEIGGPASILYLATALRDPGSAEVRQVASDALRNAPAEALVAASGQVIPALSAALSDDKWQVYYAARDALAKMGTPAVPVLTKALANPQARVGHMAQMALTRIGAPAVPGLTQVLLTGDERTRNWASIALGEIAEPAVAPLSKVVTDGGAPAPARAAAARALGATGMTAALPPLQQAASATDPSVRIAALRGMAQLDEPEATANLVAGISDSVPAVREAALEILKDWRMDPVQKLLQGVLTSGDADARRRAAVALVFETSSVTNQLLREVSTTAQAGSTQTQASLQPVLTEAALDGKAPVALRRDALTSLGYISDEKGIDSIKALLQPQEPMALPAANAIAMIGVRKAATLGEGVQERMGQAGDMLIALVVNPPSPSLGLAAAAALSNMQDIPVDSLVKQLNGQNDETKAWAGAILAAIGKPATEKVLRARGDNKLPALQRQWLASTLQIVGDAMALQLMKHLPAAEQPDANQVQLIKQKLDLIRQAQAG